MSAGADAESDDLDAFSPEAVGALVCAPGSEQDAAMFLTAAVTGLRMGELLALPSRDVDFAGDASRSNARVRVPPRAVKRHPSSGGSPRQR